MKTRIVASLFVLAMAGAAWALTVHPFSEDPAPVAGPAPVHATPRFPAPSPVRSQIQGTQSPGTPSRLDEPESAEEQGTAPGPPSGRGATPVEREIAFGRRYSDALHTELVASERQRGPSNDFYLGLRQALDDASLDSSVEFTQCGVSLCEAVLVHSDADAAEAFNRALLSGRYEFSSRGGTSNLVENSNGPQTFRLFVPREGFVLPTAESMGVGQDAF